jgi:hypothetical protein
VDDLPGALADLRSHGLRIAGSEADAPLTARQTDLRGPLAIVVGSEGQGLGPAIRRRCDLFMRIPMRGAIGSLNAAVAGSVLLFEAVAQRDAGGPEAGRSPERVRVPDPAETADATEREPAAAVDAAAEPEPTAPTEPPSPPARAARVARAKPSKSAATPPDDDLLPGGPPPPTSARPRKPRAPRTPHA